MDFLCQHTYTKWTCRAEVVLNKLTHVQSIGMPKILEDIHMYVVLLYTLSAVTCVYLKMIYSVYIHYAL